MPDKLLIHEIVDRALAEDLGRGDITTEALVPRDRQGTGVIVAKQEGVLAGTAAAECVFHRVDPDLRVEILLDDGTRVQPGSKVARVSGSIATILRAVRVALNFLQHLSGIASKTDLYVARVKGLPVRILDTRKTIPGLRALEKHAVEVVGGKNHRMDLGDGILIKDNHLVALREQGASRREIIARARRHASQHLTLEIEVRAASEASEAVEAGADIIMLDNMNLADMRRAVELVGGRALVEASGGITLENVRAVAETGVDFISIGALTHSARALDLSLELELQ